ncbi:MAG: helix-hairpin-helix domain-containing protein [Synergistaceae bacterium]|nr:helix-hairpin-helix domain-containing protein [Synergistaceae bacterium]
MQLDKDTKTKLYLFLGILFLLLAFWLVSNFKGRFGQDTVGVITTENRQDAAKQSGDLEYIEREIDNDDDIRGEEKEESDGRLLRAVPKNSSSATMIVHIVGAVKVPGVYELPANARMNDALRAAHGFVSNADRDSVNLAEKISDGQKIVFPFIARAGEDNTFTVSKQEFGTREATQGTESKRGKGTKGKKNKNIGIININTANEEELLSIVGVGKVLARSIMQYRETHGAFTAIEELLQVKGIGQKKFQKLRDQVTVR